MKGQGLLKGLYITLKRAVGKDITIQYPEQMPYLQDRFRGCLHFDYTKCIVCGLCTKACPNNVLSYESRQVEGSKKKELVSYTIDLQYCLFCNLCVEACPTNTLYFTHDFELSRYQRDQIKIVYEIPKEEPSAVKVDLKGDAPEPDETKKEKQLAAMTAALQKNPQKTVRKMVENDEDAEILAGILLEDEQKLSRMAALMIADREKAKKVAVAFVNKEKKDRLKGGGAEDESK
ncbi:4Fe-4S binding domain [Syntrophomonas zehnderi OL-4]|uniref:4Fe-4S binding domain n=1 Tax=Syntrophomonas zehnderi OL-4 TaxID=690567 RepID=A0A0E4GB10_9FIRM|nr:NADH-quinone oxidoreductase subunit I [Syntrophomonas zehnderi]CFX28905.1 4Fe-4S binding domain [Syntrophomonas zehnderi OL-4]